MVNAAVAIKMPVRPCEIEFNVSGETILVKHLFELCETVISLLHAMTNEFNSLSPNMGSCPCKVVSGNVLDIRITGNMAS